MATNKYIDVGSAPNDGTGDTLRRGGQKLNDMFAANPLNVKAEYDLQANGETDVTAQVTEAINRANSQNRPIYFPGGDYLITSQIPLYGNVPLLGDGKVRNVRYDISITEIIVNGNETEIVVDPGNADLVTHRLMSGDPIKIFGSTDSSNNGIFGIERVEPSNGVIVISTPAGATSDNSSGITGELSINEGGTILRMHSLLDGSVYTQDRFIDEDDLRNVRMKDLGFIGPGINTEFGGGIRFRRTSSTALTGYTLQDVSLAHVPMDGFRFGQLINSTFIGVNVNRCVGDAMLFKPDPGVGGANTSLNIIGSYIQNCRRGFAFYILAYSNLQGCVVEGADIGYYIERGIGVDLDGCGSETIKFNQEGSGFGETFRLVKPIGVRINGKAVYYNTNENDWSKASTVIIDPDRRVESPAGEINSGHVHPSIGPKIPVRATRWQGDSGRLYVDVSNDYGWVPPTSNTAGDWIGNSYWDDSIQVVPVGITRDSYFNERYKVTSIQKLTWVSSNTKFEEPRAPTVNDDANGAGDSGVGGAVEFDNVDGYGMWLDTSESIERNGRYFCIDDTPGDAKWVKAESLFEIEMNMRDSPSGGTLGKQAVPDGDESYVIRAGRNYGVDVSTEYIQRVLETAADGSGIFNAWLDVSEWQPTGTFVNVSNDENTDGNAETFNGGFVRKKEVIDVSGTNYLVVSLIEPDASQDVPLTNIQGQNIILKVDTHGVTHEVVADYYTQDATANNRSYYIPAEQFVGVGDTIDVYNPRLSEMEGTWTVDSVAVDTTTDAYPGMPCIKITANDRTIRTNVTRTVDDAVYWHDKFDFELGTGIVMGGLDHLFSYDPKGAIGMKKERDQSFTIPDTQTEVTLDIPGANNYTYKVSLDNSFQNIRVSNSTFNTVTVERDASSGEVTGTLEAYRKKSPTWESIYDRN